ncbi:Uncharacterised protein [Escherichia coli]|nr:Uncharacterised protein [Escherichia coli]
MNITAIYSWLAENIPVVRGNGYATQLHQQQHAVLRHPGFKHIINAGGEKVS